MRSLKKQTAMRLLPLFLLCATLCLSFPGCIRKVRDSVVSEGMIRDLTWAVGTPLPEAGDFAGELPDGATVEFAKKEPYVNMMQGENKVLLRVRSSKKGVSGTYEATLTLVKDTEAPTFSGLHDLIGYTHQNGKGYSYWQGVTVTDNCDGVITRSVNTDSVSFGQAGIYPVSYLATDRAGNTTRITVQLHIFDREITLEMLNEKIDPLIRELGLSGKSTTDQCRGIYDYVHLDSTVHYGGNSNEADRVSWIREAYLVLNSKKGDCYSYYALAKAFLERLGVENLDVQRTTGLTEDTHYWLMVNLGGSGKNAEWYHFDCTRLKQTVFSGGILTDEQVDYYSTYVRQNFYTYDRAKYPATPKIEICTYTE